MLYFFYCFVICSSISYNGVLLFNLVYYEIAPGQELVALECFIEGPGVEHSRPQYNYVQLGSSYGGVGGCAHRVHN